ncbi:DUF4180 domain-containing protein [Pseudoroseicyclus sp. CXY001]|uniref:DUF4180 domain-containing protein n=1 Tax=Pseudoroseicyclus sp. CXY001 TaxID=3242492 RepID=UPI003570F3E5
MTEVRQIGGLPAAVLPAEGPVLTGEAGALEALGESYGAEAELLVIPLARLGPDSLDLSTRQLGLMLQKFANYRQRVAFLGETDARAAESQAFHDFRYEANKGRQVLFVADEAELAALLER